MGQAARRRLQIIVLAFILCPAEAPRTVPTVNHSVAVIHAVNGSDLLVNGTLVSSGDAQFSSFAMTSIIMKRDDFDPTLLHSMALQSKHWSFKAAVLQLIAWPAKTMILAWNSLRSFFSTSNVNKCRQSPVVQIRVLGLCDAPRCAETCQHVCEADA